MCDKGFPQLPLADVKCFFTVPEIAPQDGPRLPLRPPFLQGAQLLLGAPRKTRQSADSHRLNLDLVARCRRQWSGSRRKDVPRMINAHTTLP